jgi:hypothetical protein
LSDALARHLDGREIRVHQRWRRELAARQKPLVADDEKHAAFDRTRYSRSQGSEVGPGRDVGI